MEEGGAARHCAINYSNVGAESRGFVCLVVSQGSAFAHISLQRTPQPDTSCAENLNSGFCTKQERSSFLFVEKQKALGLVRKTHTIPPSPPFQLGL